MLPNTTFHRLKFVNDNIQKGNNATWTSSNNRILTFQPVFEFRKPPISSDRFCYLSTCFFNINLNREKLFPVRDFKHVVCFVFALHYPAIATWIRIGCLHSELSGGNTSIRYSETSRFELYTQGEKTPRMFPSELAELRKNDFSIGSQNR